MKKTRLAVLLSVVVLLAVIGWQVHSAAQAPAAGSAPEYTADQARLGKVAYDQQCASCHGSNLDNGEFGPPLKGAQFLQKFGTKSLDGLFDVMFTTMPTTNPGSLGAAAYAQVLAYILQANAIVPGSRELPPDPKLLASMMLPAGDASAFTPYKAPVVKRPSPLDTWTPITDAEVNDPAPGDWLTWRRSYNAHGFSPLTQINKNNVRDLRLAWSWSLPISTTESTPLVRNGVMFIYGLGDKVQALDARTGDLLWQYSRVLPSAGLPTNVSQQVKRGIAIHGDRLYTGTTDVHVIALDVKTGSLVWDTKIGDLAGPGVGKGETVAGGPVVAKGKVMISTMASDPDTKPGGPKVVGLDEETGRIAWQVNTIAHPGEPGENSWNGVPIEKRTGASPWTSPSYDPEVGLIFVGTANTYDTAPLITPVNQPGVTNDLLYTDSTLAIDPDTGKLVWYFQHVANDVWNLDWPFEQMIVKLPVSGETRTVVMTSGKMGIYDAMDAKTGKYLFSIDAGLQNVVIAIDPKTGAKTINRDLIPYGGKTVMVCPHSVSSAKNWIPASYNPATKIVIVPLNETCMDMYPNPGGGGGQFTTGYRSSVRPRPDSDGNIGRLQAINVETRKTVWTARQRAPHTSGVLATAGGLVFAGAFDRILRAHDDANGKVLWETRLSDVLSSPPITYSVNGKQYVAIVAGRGGAQVGSFATLAPELKSPTDRSSVLWVFALPDTPADQSRSTAK